jgi:uncharacterized hydrophobic protein (TIGR00341 family)
MIQVVVPEERTEEVRRIVGDRTFIDRWTEPVGGNRVRFGFLVDSADAGSLMDELEKRLASEERFRVVLLPVEASLPRPEGEEEPEGTEDGDGGRQGVLGIGREELHADLADAAELTPVFAALTALSAVVCALGLLMDDVAVVIGAMVIAPLLGPLVALALATTLADGRLARKGATSGAGGLLLAFVLSVVIGAATPVHPEIPQVAARSSVGLGHVGLALAAGSAGTLAFTTGTAAALIGVMVAVALVPPLVAAGLLLGGGYPDAGGGALLLTLVNLIGVNLAGVVTFLALGVRPNRWWEAERARRSTAVAVAVWSLLLAGLVAAILWSPAGTPSLVP